MKRFERLYESVMAESSKDVRAAARKAGYTIGPVYRGEHGRDASDGKFHTRAGGISFASTRKVAEIYAETPNNRTLDPVSLKPKVYEVYLKIKKPFGRDDDPFVDVSYIIETLGMEKTLDIISDPHIQDSMANTSNWCEHINESGEYSSVEEYIQRHREDPEKIGLLYFDIYLIINSRKIVGWLKEKGFDGSIHMGAGVNAQQVEYQVFDQSQAKLADETTYYYWGNPIPLEKRFNNKVDDYRL